MGLSNRMRRRKGCTGRGAEFTMAAADRLSGRARGPGPGGGRQSPAPRTPDAHAAARAGQREPSSRARVAAHRLRASPAPLALSMVSPEGRSSHRPDVIPWRQVTAALRSDVTGVPARGGGVV